MSVESIRRGVAVTKTTTSTCIVFIAKKCGSAVALDPTNLPSYLSHCPNTLKWTQSLHHQKLLTPHSPFWLTSCPTDDPPPPLQIISYLCWLPPTQASSSLASLRQFTGGPRRCPRLHDSLSPSCTHTPAFTTSATPGHLWSLGMLVRGAKSPCCYTTTFTTFHMRYMCTPSISYTVSNNVCLCVCICVEVGGFCYMCRCESVFVPLKEIL